MALQPSLNFLLLGSPAAPHTLEFYLDYVCPFSAKLFHNALDAILRPAVSPSGDLAGKVKILIRLQPQPWHGSSTFTHEAALAVGRVNPEAFWEYSKILFKHQEEFFDRPTADLTPTQIRIKLVSLTDEIASIDKAQASAILDLLTYKSTPNGGVGVTDDLKFGIKLGRQNGIHVTPSAVWDGVFDGAISSSWAGDEWTKFFASKVKV